MKKNVAVQIAVGFAAALAMVSCTTDSQYGMTPQQTIYRSQYVIPEFKEIMGSFFTQTDVTLEATDNPNVVKTSGRHEWIVPGFDLEALLNDPNAKRWTDEEGVEHIEPVEPAASRPAKIEDSTWNPGARHTLKGTNRIMGFTFMSDASDPLVFRMVQNEGYVYERGRGTVISPKGQRVVLGPNN